MLIGIMGAHRVGKTTLARELQSNCDAHFSPFSASAVIAKHNLDARTIATLEQRITVQEDILEHYVDYLKITKTQHERVVVDRTPLDFIAYLYGDIGSVSCSEITENIQERITDYRDKCLHLAGAEFSLLLHVQPGIAIVEDSKSAAPQRNYIDHLDLIFHGLARYMQQVQTPYVCIPKACCDLKQRVAIAHRAILSEAVFRN